MLDILCHPNFTIHDIAPHWHWVIQFIQFTILMFHKKFPQNINSYKAIYFNESCADKTVANAGVVEVLVEVGCGRGALCPGQPLVTKFDNLQFPLVAVLGAVATLPPCNDGHQFREFGLKEESSLDHSLGECWGESVH